MIYKSTQDIFIHIRQQMIVDNIAMKDLALKLGKSPAATSALFKQDNVSLNTLNDVCKALGYSLDIDISK